MTAEPYDYSPACWEWEPPGDAFRQQVQEKYELIPARMLTGLILLEWQDGRCAACGCFAGLSGLVEDHDHETGLTRGYLCRSCNILEGTNKYDGRMWREYRERNPASICGLRERYWDSWTGQLAESAPPPTDPWENNPMQGVL